MPLHLVHCLLAGLLGLHQLSADDVVDVEQFVAGGEVAFEQVADSGDQLGQGDFGLSCTWPIVGGWCSAASPNRRR
jgi:hypothetical protein